MWMLFLIVVEQYLFNVHAFVRLGYLNWTIFIDHFLFGSVFIKKITKPKPVQTDRFRFGSGF